MSSMLSVVLARKPLQRVTAEDFALVQQPIPTPGPGQLLVRTQALSLDPYMASAIQGRHMSGAVNVGDVMPGEVVGTVEESRHPSFAVGDRVLTRGGWRSFCLAEGEVPSGLSGLSALLAPVAHKLPSDVPWPTSAYLGVLGMPGLTAYALMLRCLRPGPGDTCLVYAATGAVGSVAGQIARHMGARAVACVGTEDKARHAIDLLGYDAAVLRTHAALPEQLREACPQGIDALVTNDCGPQLATVLAQLAMQARVALIGDMSQYNSAQMLPGPALGPVIGRRATLTGFVVFDHYDLMDRWRRLASGWMTQGKLHHHEDRSAGLAAAPDAFARLMQGQTVGKAVVMLDESA